MADQEHQINKSMAMTECHARQRIAHPVTLSSFTDHHVVPNQWCQMVSARGWAKMEIKELDVLASSFNENKTMPTNKLRHWKLNRKLCISNKNNSNPEQMWQTGTMVHFWIIYSFHVHFVISTWGTSALVLGNISFLEFALIHCYS